MYSGKLHCIPSELIVERDYYQIFSPSLGNQHAIERVPVMMRQRFEGGDVPRRDVEEPVAGHVQLLGEIAWRPKLAERSLDRNLPQCRHADPQWLPRLNGFAMVRLKPVVAIERPEQNMGVDEIAVRAASSASDRRRSVAGSGLVYSSHSGPSSSKSSAIQNSPLNAPMRGNEPKPGLSGPTFTYGLPCFVMAISSPAAALRRISERLDFNCATVMFMGRSIYYGLNLGHNSGSIKAAA